MRVPLCRHLKTNGTQCQSPQMEGSNYCFFHDRLHERHKNYRFTKTTERGLIPGYSIKLHALEDAESIQVAISAVVNALAMGALDERKATALLYGLQLASSTSRAYPRSQSPKRSFAPSPRRTMDSPSPGPMPTRSSLFSRVLTAHPSSPTVNLLSFLIRATQDRCSNPARSSVFALINLCGRSLCRNRES